MEIAGLSHHTCWAILAVAINMGAAIVYLSRKASVRAKLLLASFLMALFGGVCIASLVIAGLLNRTRIFAVSCVRGNGAALIAHSIVWLILRRSRETNLTPRKKRLDGTRPHFSGQAQPKFDIALLREVSLWTRSPSSLIARLISPLNW